MKSLNRKIALLLVVFLCLSLQSLFADIRIISEEDARIQAAFALVEHVAFKTPLLDQWSEATLGESTLLFDPGRTDNGECLPLWYEFQVIRNNEPDGRVCVAATNHLGTTYLSMSPVNRPYSIPGAMMDAMLKVDQLYPGSDVLAAFPVVYQQPKLAAMIDFEPGYPGGKFTIFIDLATMKVIHSDLDDYWSFYKKGQAVSRDPYQRPAPGKTEILSYYATLPDHLLHGLEASYAQEEEIVLDSALTLCSKTGIDLYLKDQIPPTVGDIVKDTLVELGWETEDKKILPLDQCKLIEQEKFDWCARAVAQMIMYYHYNMLFHTQTQIDFYLDAYKWDNAWESALTKYYKKWLNFKYVAFDPNIDDTTYWNSAKQTAGWKNLKKQIDDDYPFCDGVQQHARMGMAYRVYKFKDLYTVYDVGIYNPEFKGSFADWECGWKDGMLGMSPVTKRYFLFTARFTP